MIKRDTQEYPYIGFPEYQGIPYLPAARIGDSLKASPTTEEVMHVPMCLSCNAVEVVGKYANEDGTGFCSAVCAGQDGPAMMRAAMANLSMHLYQHPENIWKVYGTLSATLESLARRATPEDVMWSAKFINDTYPRNKV